MNTRKSKAKHVHAKKKKSHSLPKKREGEEDVPKTTSVPSKKRKFNALTEEKKDTKNAKKKKRRRKIPKDELAWNSKSERTSGKPATNNTMYGRTNTSSNITNEKGELVPLKTAVIIDHDKYTRRHPGKVVTDFHSIASHRSPIQVSKTTTNDSPIAVDTPGGTTLGLVESFGFMRFFANKPSDTSAIIHELDVTKDFVNSPQFAGINAILDKIKYQKTTITRAKLNKTKREYINNQSRRIGDSQNAAMKKKGDNTITGSATKYVKETYLFPDMKWQWLHLVAYMIAGKKSQQADNFVAGTVEANTNMMFPEAEMRYLAKTYTQGFQLEVTANLIEGTHIATTIEYNIITPDFKLPFVFNAQTSYVPLDSFREYCHLFVVSLVEESIAARTPVKASPVKREKEASPYSSPLKDITITRKKAPSHAHQGLFGKENTPVDNNKKPAAEKTALKPATRQRGGRRGKQK